MSVTHLKRTVINTPSKNRINNQTKCVSQGGGGGVLVAIVDGGGVAIVDLKKYILTEGAGQSASREGARGGKSLEVK